MKSREVFRGMVRLVPVMLLFHVFFNSDFGSFGYLVNVVIVRLSGLLFSWPGIFLLRLGLILSMAAVLGWALNIRPVSWKYWLLALPLALPLVLLPGLPEWVLPTPYQWLDKLLESLPQGTAFLPVLVVLMPLLVVIFISLFRGLQHMRRVLEVCLVSILVMGLLLFPWRNIAVTEENQIRLTIINSLQEGRAVVYTGTFYTPVHEKRPTQLVGISYSGKGLYAPGRDRFLRDPLTGAPVEVIIIGPILWLSETQVEVEVHRVYGSAASSGGPMTLRKGDHGWEIVSWEINWQS